MHMTEPQTINASAAVTAISWTGGKDCNLALLRSWRDGNFDVRYLLVFRLCTKPFQAHVSLERIILMIQCGYQGFLTIIIDFLMTAHTIYGGSGTKSRTTINLR